MEELLSPVMIVLGLVLFAFMRFYNEFMKAAASEAGKSFGKRLGNALARKAESRFGVSGTVGLIFLGILRLRLLHQA